MILIIHNNFIIKNGIQFIIKKHFISAKARIINNFKAISEYLSETKKIICDFENYYKLQKSNLDFFGINFLIIDREVNKILDEYETDFISVEASKEVIIEKLENFFNYNNLNYENSSLTEREKEILKLVAQGLTNKEISDKLFISVYTVITHRKNISAKLGIKTISGLTTYAILNGLVEI